MFPGFVQRSFLSQDVDLRAQVRDADVASYSWDTSGLTLAENFSGKSTYNLTFNWKSFSFSGSPTQTVTLTVTDVYSNVETQTYSFTPPSDTGGSPAPSWATTYTTGDVLPDNDAFASHYVMVDANNGALNTSIVLPSYSPNIAPAVLDYDSIAADARPMVIVHHTLDDGKAVPTKDGAKLTFDGVPGTTYYYDTSLFIPGDIQHIPLQADATGLSTGRYDYSVDIYEDRGSVTTVTYNGTTTVVQESANPIGAGWTLNGLNRIVSASGGVILNVGRGDSLWFESGGGGAFDSPAGDFSTLVQNSGGTYTRTLKDGYEQEFDSGGKHTAWVDRDGLRVTYGYDSGGKLETISDPYSKIVTFGYDSGGKLETITDPAGRITTFTHSGSKLSSATMPDSAVWNFNYDGANRLTQVTDPRSKIVTVTYDSSNRVGTITRPDSTVETIQAYQVRGYDTTGTSGTPAPALLMAEASAAYTDPRGNVTDLYPDWRGMGRINQVADALGNVTTADRDENGLATIVIDRLNRVKRYDYDSLGNLTTTIYDSVIPDEFGPGFSDSSTNRQYNSFSQMTVYTDELGNVTTWTYDNEGHNTVIEDALNELTTMTYTTNGRLETVKDARTNVTTFQYDSQDRLTTVTYPGGGAPKTLIGYDTKGNANSVTDERNKVTTFAFDALNRQIGLTDAAGNVTTNTFDSGGNLTVIQAPLSRTTTQAYDAMNRVTTITDPLSNSTVMSYDSGGNLRTVTDPLSRRTTFSYDELNRQTEVKDALNRLTTTTYDAEGQVTQVADRLNRITTMTYNRRGWMESKTDPLNQTTTYSYTATGKPASILLIPVGFGGLVDHYFIAYDYDELDRLISTKDGLDHTTTQVFDEVGNVIERIDGNGNRTTFTYDVRNRQETVKDAQNNVTTFGYDDASNRTVVIDPLTHRTTYGYDALNRVTTITDANTGVTTMAFDAAGRQTGLTDPVGNRTTWAYDAADRLTTLTDPRGSTTTYLYDNANQLTDRTDRNSRRVTFAYDSGGRRTNERWLTSSGGTVRTVTWSYDNEDQLEGLADPDSLLTFVYDSGGRMTTAVTSNGAGQPLVTLSYTYTRAGNRESMTDSLGSAGITTYQYDDAERLTTMTRSLGGSSGPEVVFGYDNGNRKTSISRTIGGGGTAVATTWSYDVADRLTTITHRVVGGSLLATYVYAYDAANRVTTETNAEGTVTYTYDFTNQLTDAGGARTETYGYDSGGNRNTTGYTPDTGNRLSTSPGITYSYDNEGNMTGKTETGPGTKWEYAWDYRNRLTGVVKKNSGNAVIMQATYTYDALDRRIGTNVDADGAGGGSPVQTWFVYDGVNTYADFDSGGTLQQRYLYGPAIDELLARTSSGGTTGWYLTDKLGTVRDITNTSGTVIYHAAYDSFGTVTSESGGGNGDRFKFTAREYDSTTGLQYNRARYYNAGVGRWISEDPVDFQFGDTNLFSYTNNSPANFLDPLGLYQEPPTTKLIDNMHTHPSNQTRPPAQSKPTIIQEGTNNPLKPATILFVFPIGSETIFGIGTDMRKKLFPTKPLPVKVLPRPMDPNLDVQIAADKFKIVKNLPDGSVAGSGAADPCIGVIISSPETGHTLVYHFNNKQSPATTIDDHSMYIGPGSTAAVFGGDNSKASNRTLLIVMDTLRAHDIKVDGYHNGSELWIGGDHQYYRFDRGKGYNTKSEDRGNQN